jgi:hypothetical protein
MNGRARRHTGNRSLMMLAVACSPRLQAVVLQLDVTQRVAMLNLAGVSHDESMQRFVNGSNSINWITGHIIATRQRLLRECGNIDGGEELREYAPGTNPGLDLGTLRDLLPKTHALQRDLLCTLEDRALDGPAPFSPSGNPMSLGDLLSRIAFHEAYHVGQLGLARRLLGKIGAV